MYAGGEESVVLPALLARDQHPGSINFSKRKLLCVKGKYMENFE